MKSLIVFVVILAVLFAAAPNQPTLAQSSISYGDTVQGELTSSASKISYAFEGKRGDIAVVQMIAAPSNGAIGAQLNVTDSGGAKLADSAALIIFGRLGEIVVVEVPSDGTYTINVESGSSGTTGAFDLVLLQAEFLELNSPVEGEASSTPDDQRGRYSNFYVVESRSDVELRYERLSGNYTPAMIVLGVEAGNNLFERAFLGGSLLTKGSITIEGSRDFRLVTVGSLNFGSSGRGTVQTSTFRLTLANAD
ncbi:MAG: hypothetical protein DYG88_14085 [Chloroflexi bacterium CFX4]|nr:hypothetical protein [Chloroflexi bacterium CFX4]MDL1923898.1 hypothetical protein [Chloroflexi bacterium CFX3]